VEQFPIVVNRRSPAASRPPANYVLAYENAYYLAWRRTDHPVVLAHLPEQGLYTSTGVVSCPTLAKTVAGAPAGTELIAAVAPEMAYFEPLYSRDRSFAWGYNPGQQGAVMPNAAGHASAVLHVRGGRYAVWVQGDFPEPILVQLDGRLLGTLKVSNTPLQWDQVASLQLAPGAHTLRLVRPAGHRHLGPGEWSVGTIGAAALQREASERLEPVALNRWRTLCGKQLDWVELVRP
jgi:hypothetical protein